MTITLTDYKTGDVLRTRSVKAVDGVAAFGDLPINHPDAYKLTITDVAGHIPAVVAVSEQPLPGSRPIDDPPAPIVPTAAAAATAITAAPAADAATPQRATTSVDTLYTSYSGVGSPLHLTSRPTLAGNEFVAVHNVVVTVVDQAGHADPTYDGPVTITLTDYKTGDVFRTRTVTAVDGVADFGDYKIDHPYAYTLTVTDGAGHVPSSYTDSEQPLPGSRVFVDPPATVTAAPAAVTVSPRQARRAAARAGCGSGCRGKGGAGRPRRCPSGRLDGSSAGGRRNARGKGPAGPTRRAGQERVANCDPRRAKPTAPPWAWPGACR